MRFTKRLKIGERERERERERDSRDDGYFSPISSFTPFPLIYPLLFFFIHFIVLFLYVYSPDLSTDLATRRCAGSYSFSSASSFTIVRPVSMMSWEWKVARRMMSSLFLSFSLSSLSLSSLSSLSLSLSSLSLSSHIKIPKMLVIVKGISHNKVVGDFKSNI